MVSRWSALLTEHGRAEQVRSSAILAAATNADPAREEDCAMHEMCATERADLVLGELCREAGVSMLDIWRARRRRTRHRRTDRHHGSRRHAVR